MKSELEQLASILADWSRHKSAVIYLFGSRARGDHRPNSDVDVVIKFPRVTEADAHWWLANNEEEFTSINALLPGPLKILENDDPIAEIGDSGGRISYPPRSQYHLRLAPAEEILERRTRV